MAKNVAERQLEGYEGFLSLGLEGANAQARTGLWWEGTRYERSGDADGVRLFAQRASIVQDMRYLEENGDNILSSGAPTVVLPSGRVVELVPQRQPFIKRVNDVGRGLRHG